MHFELTHFIYGALALLTLFAAVMTVMQSHPVRSVLFLVLTFFSAATLWLTLQAEFLSLILVLVYVGAVMTLFLFVVMMLHVDAEAMRSHLFRLLPLSFLVVGGLSALFMVAFQHSSVYKAVISTQTVVAPASLLPKAKQPPSNAVQIGEMLFTQYVYPFEIAAILLLVAMVAAITLTHRNLKRSRQQNVRDQIMTNAKDRITMLSLNEPVEKG